LDEETWGIEDLRVIGDTEKPETWERLGNEIERALFKREDGIELRPVALAIDIHYRPRQTREWCQRHGTRCMVFPVFGIGGQQPTLVVDRWNKHYAQRTWSVQDDLAKDILFARLRINTPGPRYCHFPRGHGYDERWFAQLTAERAVTRYIRGFPKRVYEKTSGVRNEAIDKRKYALAALDILRPNLPALAAQLKPKDKNAPPGNPVTTGARRSGWVTGWK
jgi:phage terminase large subunit GpA-like protein